jgi:hypothetical protein
LLEAHPIVETPFATAGLRAAKPRSHKHLSAGLKVIQKCLPDPARPGEEWSLHGSAGPFQSSCIFLISFAESTNKA